MSSEQEPRTPGDIPENKIKEKKVEGNYQDIINTLLITPYSLKMNYMILHDITLIQGFN